MLEHNNMLWVVFGSKELKKSILEFTTVSFQILKDYQESEKFTQVPSWKRIKFWKFSKWNNWRQTMGACAESIFLEDWQTSIQMSSKTLSSLGRIRFTVNIK